MSLRDADANLRKVAALREFCLKLPHLPTPLETARLRRFDELVAHAASATASDVEALVAGWRQWWRAGRTAELRAMVGRVPQGIVQSDRRLATYAVAAEHVERERPA